MGAGVRNSLRYQAEAIAKPIKREADMFNSEITTMDLNNIVASIDDRCNIYINHALLEDPLFQISGHIIDRKTVDYIIERWRRVAAIDQEIDDAIYSE